jgi:heat shock protein HslJ
MKWLGLVTVAPALLLSPAIAQDVPRDFPLDRTFRAISISGFDVQKAGMTLAVARDARNSRLMGSGNAGCNSWTATIVLREEQIDVAEIVTTRKACAKPRMTSEGAFLTALKSAHRWRLDGAKLILEGDSARLLLTSAGGDKPAKKQAQKPAARPQASR